MGHDPVWLICFNRVETGPESQCFEATGSASTSAWAEWGTKIYEVSSSWLLLFSGVVGGSYFWRLYVASQVITKKGKLFSSEFARCFLGFTLPRSDRKRVWSNSGLMATSFQDPWRFVHSFDAPLWFHRKAGSNVCMSLLLFFFGGFFCKVQLLIEDAVATTTWIVTNYYHFDGDDEFDSYYIFSLVLDTESWCFFIMMICNSMKRFVLVMLFCCCFLVV